MMATMLCIKTCVIQLTVTTENNLELYMHILSEVKAMGKSHSKHRWKKPRQDMCKPNSVIF